MLLSCERCDFERFGFFGKNGGYLDVAELGVSAHAEGGKDALVESESHSAQLRRESVLELASDRVQRLEEVALLGLVASASGDVAAALALALGHLAVAAHGTAHVAAAALASEVVALLETEEAVAALRTGLGARVRLAEALAVLSWFNKQAFSHVIVD